MDFNGIDNQFYKLDCHKWTQPHMGNNSQDSERFKQFVIHYFY